MVKALTFVLSVVLSGAVVGQGLIFDEEEYERLDPMQKTRTDTYFPKYSLKEYTPYTLDQGGYGKCVAYALSSARAMFYAVHNNLKNQKDLITAQMMSPHWIYEKMKPENHRSCQEGLSVGKTIAAINTKGSASLKDIEYPNLYPFTSIYICDNDEEYSEEILERQVWKFDGVRKIKGQESELIKIAISKNQPVLLGMRVTESFKNSKGVERWRIKMKNGDRKLLNDPKKKKALPGHAMLIVGYDESKFGGAFELLNSYGPEFGENGYIWVSEKDLMKSKIAFWELICTKKNGDLVNEFLRTHSDGSNLVISAAGSTNKKTTVDPRFERVAQIIEQLK